MKKIAVVLAGCGNKDGTEITEAVSLIISLSNLGAEIHFFAPDFDISAKNFLTNKELNEKRNLLLESARITRSQIQDLNSLVADDFDGLALPGGQGAVLHLCNWKDAGSNCKVLPDLEQLILQFHRLEKPIAAICIAPVILAKVLEKSKITITLGKNSEVVSEVLKLGVLHEECDADDFISDRHNKIITSPAYMIEGTKPHKVFNGISGLAKELIEMA